MNRFFSTVWSDLKQRKNLELYLILLVAVVVLFADILGVETVSALFEIVLASLSILIYGLIESRHTNERVEQQLANITQSVQELRRNEVRAADFFLINKSLSQETFSSASTICLLGYSLSRTIREHHHALRQRLKAGAHIRIIILDLTDECLLKKAALESISTTAELWHHHLEVTRSAVNSLAIDSGDRGKVEIGYLPYAPSFGMVLVDSSEPNGFNYVDIYHHKSTAPNAAFKLSASTDPVWFAFFKQQFEILWKSCRVEELPY